MKTIEEVQNELEAFTGDKRSKEYKVLKEEIESLRNAPRGLGDVVKDVIKVTGLDKLVEPDCEACKNRQSMLNDWGDRVRSKMTRLFQGRQVKDMTEDDYQYLSEFLKDGIPSSIASAEQKRLNTIYYNVSGIQRRQTSCSPCVVKVVKALESMFNEYNK